MKNLWIGGLVLIVLAGSNLLGFGTSPSFPGGFTQAYDIGAVVVGIVLVVVSFVARRKTESK